MFLLFVFSPPRLCLRGPACLSSFRLNIFSTSIVVSRLGEERSGQILRQGGSEVYLLSDDVVIVLVDTPHIFMLRLQV